MNPYDMDHILCYENGLFEKTQFIKIHFMARFSLLKL